MKHLKTALFVGSFALAMTSFAQTGSGAAGAAGTAGATGGAMGGSTMGGTPDSTGRASGATNPGATGSQSTTNTTRDGMSGGRDARHAKQNDSTTHVHSESSKTTNTQSGSNLNQ